ncbi:MAG: YfhO family protein [Clostridia bacterium]|nr:YfhO family protein [Clostridia bacterium]
MTYATGTKLSRKDREGFFRRNMFIILAFIAPAMILATVFAVRQFFPFGNKMIMVVDSWHQYYPFLAEYQRMLKEGESVLYSWNTGGGANFLGIIGDYLGSPLYLLSYFVPSGTPWLQVFLALTVVVRVGCAGGFSAIFFRKVFGRNDLSLVYFSVMYALCAYVLGYYWNMMWLDTVALLPLVAAGTITVLRDKKFSLYIISLALAVTFNFYIGYMVCIFVLLLSIAYTVVSFVSFKESLKNAGRMVLYTLIAFMLTAIITVPVFMALKASDSAAAVSGFPTEYTINYGYGYEGNGIMQTLWAIACTATNLLAFTRPIVYDQGEPNIACGVLALVLSVFYFTTKKIKIREKIVSCSLLVFFILSFVINQLNYIWHGMNTPAMVYYRWSFIFSFALIVMAYRAFTLIDSFSKKSFVFASILLVLYLGASCVTQRLASVAVTALAAVVIVVGFALYRAGKMKYRVLSLLLCLFVMCEAAVSTYYGVRVVGDTEIDDYPMNYAEVGELMEVAESQSGNQIYRTEFISPFAYNPGALYSIYGVTTFNSMVDSTYADFFAESGVAANVANNRYVYFENTPVMNLFLNIKYLIGKDGEKARDTVYFAETATTDECTLYENTAYVPMGFMASKNLLQCKLHDKSHFPMYSQNDLLRNATGIEKDVFEILPEAKPLSDEKGTPIEKNEKVEHRYIWNLEDKTATDDEATFTATAEYVIEEDGSYYGIFGANPVPGAKIRIKGSTEDEIKITDKYTYTTPLGKFKKGDVITVELGAQAGVKNSLACRVFRIDEDVMREAVEILSKNTMTLTEWGDRYLTGTITADEDGLFYTSVFHTEGWRAYVDGEEVEITPVADTFIAFELSEGEHSIELRFTPKGMYLGIGITALGAVIFALLRVISSRKKSSVVRVALQDAEGFESQPEEEFSEPENAGEEAENSDEKDGV